MSLEAIKIDNTLEDNEKKVIDELKIDDKNTTEILKSTLKKEKLAGVDQSFLDIATAFDTYKVEFSMTKETDPNVVSKPIAKCDATAPERLKKLVNDKDQNDFVYFMYKISTLLQVGKAEELEKETFGLQTIAQLKNLKAEIVKSETPNNVVPEILVLNTDKIGKLYFRKDLEMTSEKLKTTIEGYDWKNNDIKKEIFSFINEGKIRDLQDYLYTQNGGGTENTMNSRKNGRDGMLGAGTLGGIEKIATQTAKKTEEEIKNIKPPVDSVITKPTTNETGTNTDIQKDTYGNDIIQIQSMDDLNTIPASHRWTEKKVYALGVLGKTFTFYGNGRVKLSDRDGKNVEMKNTDEVIALISKNASNILIKKENESPIKEKTVPTENNINGKIEIPKEFAGLTPDQLDNYVDKKDGSTISSNGETKKAQEAKINQYTPYQIDGEGVGVVLHNILQKNYTDEEKGNKLLDEIISKNDPIINAYILYKAMESAGTTEELIQKLIDNKNVSRSETYKAFGTTKGENLISRLFGDLDATKGGDEAIMLDTIITKLSTENDSVVMKEVIAYLNNHKWKPIYLPKTYAQFQSKINEKGVIT